MLGSRIPWGPYLVGGQEASRDDSSPWLYPLETTSVLARGKQAALGV